MAEIALKLIVGFKKYYIESLCLEMFLNTLKQYFVEEAISEIMEEFA
jgi:hypothetical protein